MKKRPWKNSHFCLEGEWSSTLALACATNEREYGLGANFVDSATVSFHSSLIHEEKGDRDIAVMS